MKRRNPNIILPNTITTTEISKSLRINDSRSCIISALKRGNVLALKRCRIRTYIENYVESLSVFYLKTKIIRAKHKAFFHGKRSFFDSKQTNKQIRDSIIGLFTIDFIVKSFVKLRSSKIENQYYSKIIKQHK
jgi:hypothetical protein